ncbi:MULTISPECIES: L-aspartate oxidase [unclassified Brevibacterium]|uniref:L-aspartate oxidase n=1 Tax=unclassified Brevibacterium TaxID=2614124 RepID=UPI001E4FED11|nr:MULTISPECIES: L-aspartate oxidase [unclassified Brevibacterium]MCD1285611.1 L-aspartate oxidase [Brevibacterium sp. CCUG 69071]MDK8434666.1 L-aspartate oxidase [Brevibacterium sp. H-BE7]
MSRIVIIGSGIAGLSAALRLAAGHEVTLVTKDCLGESNTAFAQGGIAGVVGAAEAGGSVASAEDGSPASAEDSVASHIADTLAAGAGLCDEDAVRVLCEEGPDRIRELAAAGVAFDRDASGAWARGMEGAHSTARIFHSGGDATGRAIIDALSRALLAEVAAGRVNLHEETMLVDVLTDGRHGGHGVRAATGVSLLHRGAVTHLPAEAIVLATGGAGRLFAHTTNPASATGDGLAAAIRAGAAVRDLEFFQFHPTALAGAGFLVSEAVRGAGAQLLDAAGHRFMPEVDSRAELAPRDVVALGVHRRMAAQGGRPCLLDVRAVPEVAERFPSITKGLAEHGLDPAVDLIPVTPAAHYFMGGIATDLDGRTSIDGLYAIGEVACTGVHGANRLASNSLLEGAVFGIRAAAAIGTGLSDSAVGERLRDGVDGDLPATTLPRTELQDLAWTHLGVERSEAGLRTLLDRLGAGEVSTAAGGAAKLATAVGGERTPHTALAEGIETANLALIAAEIARHALARRESRGAHTRTDFPADLLQEAS